MMWKEAARVDCPRCGIEMRVDSRMTDDGLEQSFFCRNPQCGAYQTVQAVVRPVILKEETDET